MISRGGGDPWGLSERWGLEWEEPFTEEHAWTSAFTAALFTIAKLWSQPKCPATGEWMKNTELRGTGEIFSATNKLNFVALKKMETTEKIRVNKLR